MHRIKFSRGAHNPTTAICRSSTRPTPYQSRFDIRHKIEKTNQLYRIVVDILLIAMKHNSVISLENPYRSWFWAAILAYVQAQNNLDPVKFWDSLTEVFFHNCCHGGQRKKGTRWKSTPGFLQPYQPFAKMIMNICPTMFTQNMAHGLSTRRVKWHTQNC